MRKRYVHDIEIAIEALRTNKLKSILTALGILFGVAAVISMLAIGQGAKQEILQQMETIGANNIVIEAKLTTKGTGQNKNNGGEGDTENTNTKKNRYSPGLNEADYRAIKEIIPGIVDISPEIILESSMIHKGRQIEGKGIGISADYLNIYNLSINRGTFFTAMQEAEGKPVCILGSEVATNLFREQNPVGASIKFGHVWLKVVGVLENERIGNISMEKYGLSNRNESIYVPRKTMILRLKNREVMHHKPSSGNQFDFYGGFTTRGSDREKKNYHLYDRIIIKMERTEDLNITANLIDRMLTRRHNGKKDYEIIIPELLLKQKQETREIFNFVLGAIAGISLLVGGIGIMNIMFATVMERIREIGIRMAIGGRKQDILVQFMTEAILISLIGGILGIIFGVSIAGIIEKFTEIQTQVTLPSVLLAFLVSVSVGIIFGYSPAKKAAKKDPVESLRHE